MKKLLFMSATKIEQMDYLKSMTEMDLRWAALGWAICHDLNVKWVAVQIVDEDGTLGGDLNVEISKVQ